ncbi:hypothetical protein CYMTET_43603 [Cymbomonas tetramitiformis]|uniref:Uncharacterized protein n=1 Tax=Cymbomonas tetramitiformis TaxID=36881 RepID=A0AAE0F1H3_9CHLO|nr:hypothetical protein CYMTET_43603 [Cymbomonas tetramitiformis]
MRLKRARITRCKASIDSEEEDEDEDNPALMEDEADDVTTVELDSDDEDDRKGEDDVNEDDGDELGVLRGVRGIGHASRGNRLLAAGAAGIPVLLSHPSLHEQPNQHVILDVPTVRPMAEADLGAERPCWLPCQQ